MSTQGRFVWHDLMSTDPEAAKKFYTQLLGWKTTDEEAMGTYTTISANGRGLGGIAKLDASHGMSSHWSCYLNVESVDGAAERAVSLGGRICVPPTDIPNVGRFAVLQDPKGVLFSIYKDKEAGVVAGEGVPSAGTFCWYELMTPDPEALVPFYQALFGWRVETSQMTGETYWLCYSGDRQVCGMAKTQAGAPEAPHWLPFLAVEDLEASTNRAKGLGAQITVPPTDIPKIGRFSVLLDPTGAAVALFSS